MAAPFRTQADEAGAIQPVRLWDPVIRLTHWGIALMVLANAVLTEGGSRIHVWAGWAGLARSMILSSSPRSSQTPRHFGQ